MDKVIIKDLLVRGIIGINDWEREKKQDILINITAFADLHQAGITDNIDNCVNYRTLAKKVIAYVEQANRYTVEGLASDIVNLCLEQPRVERAVVRVEKPRALRFASSVGVEFDRSK
ncbi:MAG TPA: dihydroneopterin aldolase [Anaerolineae bacterium]|nr:dihydroneopterin aldolase [Anaerolineae bacterium]